jgi:hypothetical protein
MLPAWRVAGVSEEQTRVMLVDNAQWFFAGEDAAWRAGNRKGESEPWSHESLSAADGLPSPSSVT